VSDSIFSIDVEDWFNLSGTDGNDNRAQERIANRLFRHAMLVRYQDDCGLSAGCRPHRDRYRLRAGPL
jgi:hypothetical protein